MSSTSPVVATPAGGALGPRVTYARARLRLGIASVGTIVVLAAAALALGLPAAALPESTVWAATDLAWLALVVALYVAVSAPFDLLGGSTLPVRYGRPVTGARFGRIWARGVFVHGAFLLVAALALLVAGRAAGDAGALGAAALLMLVLLAAQVPVARLVGGVRRRGDRLSAEDPSFVGGIAGVPGRDRLLMAAPWDEELTAVQAARRRAVQRSGARALGVIVAMAFNLAGLALVLWATPASADSVAGVVSLALWMTLWSFLGLLLLPSLSRPAVMAADRAALEAGIDHARLVGALRRLDAAQEDEPRRSRLVESIFHPVPARDRRIAAIEQGSGPALPRPWHTARMALLLSWPALGLLSRAVHCNCGRPALWVFLPGD